MHTSRSVIGGPGRWRWFGAIAAEASGGERKRDHFPCAEQDERDGKRKRRVPDQGSAASRPPGMRSGALKFLHSAVRSHGERGYPDSQSAAKPLSHPCRPVVLRMRTKRTIPARKRGRGYGLAAQATASTKHPAKARATKAHIDQRIGCRALHWHGWCAQLFAPI